MTLLNYRANVYSQNGEDGILEELLSLLGIDQESECWCVKFGAWDGKFLSNTFNLVEARGWRAVYIEADPIKYRDLELTARNYKSIHPILGMVGGVKGGGSALDDLLALTDIPINYEVLSIDIDSHDLDIWARHIDYRPSIVVIEINSFIQPGILQWHMDGVLGNSFSATVNVALTKGYTLVCHTGNLIFVKDELAGLVGLDELDRRFPERLFLHDWIKSSGSRPISRAFVGIRSYLPEPVKRPLRRVLGG